MLGAAEAIRGAAGGPLSAHDRDRMHEVTQLLEQTVPELYRAWWESGTVMTENEASAYARDD